MVAGAVTENVLFVDAEIPDKQDKKHEETDQEQIFQALRLKDVHVRVAFHISPTPYEAAAGSRSLWNTGILVTIQRNTQISVKMIISVMTISIQVG